MLFVCYIVHVSLLIRKGIHPLSIRDQFISTNNNIKRLSNITLSVSRRMCIWFWNIHLSPKVRFICTSAWLFNEFLWVNLLPQTLQAYGFSPVCILSCMVSSDWQRFGFPQKRHKSLAFIPMEQGEMLGWPCWCCLELAPGTNICSVSPQHLTTVHKGKQEHISLSCNEFYDLKHTKIQIYSYTHLHMELGILVIVEWITLSPVNLLYDLVHLSIWYNSSVIAVLTEAVNSAIQKKVKNKIL